MNDSGKPGFLVMKVQKVQANARYLKICPKMGHTAKAMRHDHPTCWKESHALWNDQFLGLQPAATGNDDGDLAAGRSKLEGAMYLPIWMEFVILNSGIDAIVRIDTWVHRLLS
jgi:hypothetical protein